MLENLRFHPEEEADDEGFARELAKLAEVYVNDAFGCSHRAHASVHALAKLMPQRAAGLLVHKEVAALEKLRTGAEHPFVAVLGGAKVSDKIEVIEALHGARRRAADRRRHGQHVPGGAGHQRGQEPHRRGQARRSRAR